MQYYRCVAALRQAVAKDVWLKKEPKVIQRSIVADKQTVENANAKVAEAGRDTPQDRALNRKVATDAIVLLKNSAGILPLDPRKIKTIAVVGPNAKTRTVSGGGEYQIWEIESLLELTMPDSVSIGSAYLTASYIVPPLKGIQDALEGTGVQVKYTAGCYGTSLRSDSKQCSKA
jgi:beta-glucosidase